MKAKFSLNSSQKVEFVHNGDTLQDNLSLMDLAYMYNWKRVCRFHILCVFLTCYFVNLIICEIQGFQYLT